MEATKHTPGPWIYGVRRDGSIWLSIGDRNTGPHYQADLCASPDDARLIAAAPELLAALEAAEELHRVGLFGAQPGQIQQVNDMRQAAIAKATGS